MIVVLELDARQGVEIFLSTTVLRKNLGPNQPPTQWLPGALSLGVKRPGREADRSPPFRTNNSWSYTSKPTITPPGVVLS
jgi:hypothetical protein